jgi:archaellum biogenesis ATPase FlaH
MVNILAIISNYTYQGKIYQIVKDAEKTNDKILYVSLNKTYKTLLVQFKQDNIDLSKFFFIDVITVTVIDPKPAENCLFLPSADDVRALYAGIIKTVKEKGIDMVIFDSLSSLTTYKNSDEIVHFVTTLLGSLSLLDCSAVFTCLLTDVDARLIQHVKMKVDKSYELS